MNTVLVIGSNAINQHFTFRQSNDIDMIGHVEDFFEVVSQQHMTIVKLGKTKGVAKTTTGKFCEYQFVDFGGVYSTIYWFALDVGNVKNFSLFGDDNTNFVYPSLEFLLSLKMTHRFKDSVHFEKTRNDILQLMRCGISPMKNEVFDEIETAFLTKPVKLSESAENFFRKTDKFYQANHDDIHQSILGVDLLGEYNKKPAYMSILGDDAEVYCDPKKWLELDFNTKCKCAVEEACTLAIERIFIPKNGLDSCLNGTCDVGGATEVAEMFETSLRKLCTRITSGRFRTFAWTNLDAIRGTYRQSYKNYISNFIAACVNGKVRRFDR